MKRILLMAIPVLALLSGCREGFGDQESSDCTVQGSAVQECMISKMAVSLKDGKFSWAEDDSIAVCTSTAGKGKFKPFVLTSGAGESFAEFHGSTSRSSIRRCAVYPYSKSLRFRNDTLMVALPDTMTYDRDTVALPMYASAQDLDQYGIFYFKQLGGMLSLKVTSLPAGTSRVVMTAGGAKLSGEFPVIPDSTGFPYIRTAAAANEKESSFTLVVPKTAQPSEMVLNFPMPQGEYERLDFVACGEKGETLGFFRTLGNVSIVRGGITVKTAVKSIVTDKYYQKVTADRTSWEGNFLLVYEEGDMAYVMYSDSHYADADAKTFILPLDKRGLPDCDEIALGKLIIKKHAPDATKKPYDTAQSGYWSIFIQGGLGIGRYALATFGFNNNVNFGRFLNGIKYNSKTGSVEMTSVLKTGDTVNLRFDTTRKIFGFGTSTETKGSNYVSKGIQLYEIK